MRPSAGTVISRAGSQNVYLPACFSAVPSFRQASTHALQSSLHKKLTVRRPNLIYDYLSPTPAHLLNISLADFLPASCYPPGFSKENLELPRASLHGISHSNVLAQGHHLVYFAPQVPGNKLLPDGTDPLQSPGEPFVRRMWAGGTLSYNNYLTSCLQLDNRRAYCQENIPEVFVKGSEGNEKVFVSIERQIGYCDASVTAAPDSKGAVQSTKVDTTMLSPAITETRNIVFMRGKPAATAKEGVDRPRKILKPILAPDFSVAFTPTQSLLFRFSALTLNAHLIHLDLGYCREMEGHRNLLVHGPLTLVLMLSVLRSQLDQGEKVKMCDYKNLAPLYAEEELRVCVKKDMVKGNKYDVWIEGPEGGYAVKGSAITDRPEDIRL